VIIAVWSSLLHANWEQRDNYVGDGAREVAAYLNQNLTKEESLFVWGYRPDLYIRLERLSPYPIMNYQIIHPDGAVKTKEERLKHIYPKYEEHFISLLDLEPPDYVVTVNQEKLLWSLSSTKVLSLIADAYEKVYEIKREDFRGNEIEFRVFRRSYLENGTIRRN